MQGIEYFKQAIGIAPDYALAYAGMADCYTALAEYSVSPPEGVAQAAKEAALRALELDDTLPEAHAALGYIRIVYDWDWRGAERDFRRAIDLDPYYAPAHHRYAVLLSIMGRYDEGVAEIRQAQALEPNSVAISMSVGILLCDVGLIDAAIEELERAIEMDPGSFASYLTLGIVYMYAQRYDDAIAAFQEEDRLLGGQSPHSAAMIAMARALSGDVDEAERSLAELREISKHQPVSPALVALLCFTLDRRDEGFEWLDRAYDERDLILRLLLPVLKRPDIVGDDPRIHDLVGRMGLEQ
jgi:tetratricopeptide (TPR) repeat protein